jgi:hypothetical protein
MTKGAFVGKIVVIDVKDRGRLLRPKSRSRKRPCCKSDQIEEAEKYRVCKLQKSCTGRCGCRLSICVN